MYPLILIKAIVFLIFSGKDFLLHLFKISSGIPFVINLNSLLKKLYIMALEFKVPFFINLLYILNLYEFR